MKYKNYLKDLVEKATDINLETLKLIRNFLFEYVPIGYFKDGVDLVNDLHEIIEELENE